MPGQSRTLERERAAVYDRHPMRVVGGFLAITVGCYQPDWPERQDCTDTTNLCPPDQQCTLLYHECARLPLCEDSTVKDSFDGGTPCEPWGMHFGNGGMAQVKDGQLVMSSLAGDQSGCRVTNAPFQRQGFFAEVAKTPLNGATRLSIGSTLARIEVSHQATIAFTTNSFPVASKTYDATAMRWWRLRPETNLIIAEYSPDGIEWTLLGMRMTSVPTKPELDLEVTNDTGMPDAMEIASLGVCPAATETP
jgi:hypothetical protein